MEVKREKQTDWSGTIGGLAGMNNISENTEIDENSPEYKKWREEEKSILIPSDARIEKIKDETTNNGKATKRNKSFSTTSKKTERNTEKTPSKENMGNNKKKCEQPKSTDQRETGR